MVAARPPHRSCVGRFQISEPAATGRVVAAGTSTCPASGARQLTLQRREAVDQLDRFEGSVAAADRRLLEHAGLEEARDRCVDRLHAAAGECRGALNRDERGAGQRVEQEIDRGVPPYAAEAPPPCLLEFQDAPLICLRVGHGAATSGGKQRDPGVDGLDRVLRAPPRWRVPVRPAT
jgi:hypothetical protein